MVSWQCPYCGKTMHSAWDKRTDEAVVCIHCDGTFENKYYREKKGETHEKRVESNLERD